MAADTWAWSSLHANISCAGNEKFKGTSSADRRGIRLPGNWSTTGLVKILCRLDLPIVSSEKKLIGGVLFLMTPFFFFKILKLLSFASSLLAQEQPLLGSSGAIARFCILWHYLLFWSASTAETRMYSSYVFHVVIKIQEFAVKAGLLKGNWRHIWMSLSETSQRKRQRGTFWRSHHYSLNNGRINVLKFTHPTPHCSQFRVGSSLKGSFLGVLLKARQEALCSHLD